MRSRHSGSPGRSDRKEKIFWDEECRRDVGSISEGTSLVFWNVNGKEGEILSDLQGSVTVTLQ